MNYYCVGLSFPLTNANFSVAAGRRTLAGSYRKRLFKQSTSDAENKYIVRMRTRLFLVPNTPRNYEVQCIYILCYAKR